MIDEKTKRHYLEKILNSSNFIHTKRYKELLRYLVESKISGVNLKESTIAIEQFNRGANFNPSTDTIVRVSISNIRKKLANYYFTEGVEDAVQIKLPKGSYDVLFREIKQKKKIKWDKWRPLLPYGLVVLLGLSVVSALFFYLENKSLKKQFFPVAKNNPIWSEFINASLGSSIVLGDYFFMYEAYKDYRVFVRDPRINSLAEYQAMDEPLKAKWKPLEFTYLPPIAASICADIVPVLKMNPEPFDIKFASEVDWNDFNQKNIIYAGTYKSMFIIKQLMPLMDIQITLDSTGYTLLHTDESDANNQSYQLPLANQGELHTDYSLIYKLKGPNNNAVMVIASGDNVGIAKAVKTITAPNFRQTIGQHLDDKSLKAPFYFQMIIKTQGFRQTGFTHEIVYFKQIEG